MGKKKGTFGKNNNNHKRKHEDIVNETNRKKKGFPNSKNKKKMKSHRQNQQKNNNGNRNFKRKQLWIDRCTSNKPPKDYGEENIIEVLVSGVELSDDHTHTKDSKIKNNDKKDAASIQKEANSRNNDEKDTTSLRKENNKDSNDGLTNTTSNQNKDAANENRCEKRDEEGNVKINDEQSSNETNTSKVQVMEEEDVDVAKKSDKQAKKKEIVLAVEEVTIPIIYKNPFVHLIRCKSANTKKIVNTKYFQQLANGDCGDGIVNPFPKDEVDDKYWAQRKRFFTKFDDGIELDKESWYSVTPEAIAKHVAKRMAEEVEQSRKDEHTSRNRTVILDAFCGCGGNAIGFAKLERSHAELIICVDIDRSKLKMAANNASIYGIENDRIIFIESDSTFILQQCYKDGTLVDLEGLSAVETATAEMKHVETEIVKGYKIGGLDLLPQRLDAIFLSPPWGGPDYMGMGKKGYLLQSITLPSWDKTTIDGEDLLLMSKRACKQRVVVYFVPRTINGNEVGKSAFKAGYRGIEVEKNVLNGKVKTVTIYCTK